MNTPKDSKQEIRNVLWTFLILIISAILINLIVWLLVNNNQGKEILLVSQGATIFLALPILCHFFMVIYLTGRQNKWIYWLSKVLNLFNVLLLIGGFFIISLGTYIVPLTALSFLYYGIGAYLYLRTIIISRQTLSSSQNWGAKYYDYTILDDDLKADL